MKSRITKRQRVMLDRIGQTLGTNNDPTRVAAAFRTFDKSIKDAKSRKIGYEFKRLFLRAANDPAIRPDALALLGSWGDTIGDQDIFHYVVTCQGNIWLEIFAPVKRLRRKRSPRGRRPKGTRKTQRKSSVR